MNNSLTSRIVLLLFLTISTSLFAQENSSKEGVEFEFTWERYADEINRSYHFFNINNNSDQDIYITGVLTIHANFGGEKRVGEEVYDLVIAKGETMKQLVINTNGLTSFTDFDLSQIKIHKFSRTTEITKALADGFILIDSINQKNPITITTTKLGNVKLYDGVDFEVEASKLTTASNISFEYEMYYPDQVVTQESQAHDNLPMKSQVFHCYGINHLMLIKPTNLVIDGEKYPIDATSIQLPSTYQNKIAKYLPAQQTATDAVVAGGTDNGTVSENERIQLLKAEMDKAVSAEDYSKAALLKEEIGILKQISEAVNAKDYIKAGELQKTWKEKFGDEVALE
ncbi:UvrB/UvrC motif-containing protein [Flammeovirga yaeyamensis]|uniref:UvrB/UvrC motif-containing protein n=1 Tax=Flammeovirga yaeyamensis TaxID=367791 RepID=A0AAX1NCC2_9BACT|nr:UvrB/UvrC motif-containing protein [Flammeovirga yaeyamensis]MBB3696891.1 hypothetical protein [Flammeovirga yaeyamensis]NMF33555.1 hypothetical protein [Flammeovirga yaeyamensis]QWG05176.1 UvrB/UvrC motif-containing protein [Flammeovirga yaeyamensis]